MKKLLIILSIFTFITTQAMDRFTLPADSHLNPVEQCFLLGERLKLTDLEILHLYLLTGASANDCDDSGKTPLMYAIMNKNIEVVQGLISAGADVNAQDNEGLTPLMYAVIYEKLYVLYALIQAGANINLSSYDGRTPLALARYSVEKRILSTLINAQRNHEISRIAQRLF